MSKKTNPTIYRLKKYKNWTSRSFFENYNYSNLLYQDMYIENFLENFLIYNISDSFVHEVSIQRKEERIFIFLDYYTFKKNNRKFNARYRPSLLKKKKNLKLRRKSILYKFYLSVTKNLNNTKDLYPTIYSRRTFSPSLPLEKLGPFYGLNQEGKTFSFFTLKRLLILNLMFLTGGSVSLYARNIGFLRSSLLPFFKKKPYFNKKKNAEKLRRLDLLSHTDHWFPKSSVALRKRYSYVPPEVKDDAVLKLIKHLNLRFFPPRKLRGLDVGLFVHLIYTSFIFKSPALLGKFISRHIGKNIKLFYLFIIFIKSIVSALFFYSNLKGLKIQIKGRLGRSLRKRTKIIQFGAMPSHGIDNLIYYSFNEAITIYGICGIKVWYYY